MQLFLFFYGSLKEVKAIALCSAELHMKRFGRQKMTYSKTAHITAICICNLQFADKQKKDCIIFLPINAF
jgi:hypothetical protein